ncbi:hypothetical protein D3C72_988270 [compost metagenome]
MAAGTQANLVRQRLGRLIQHVDVVVAIVEEVAHRLIGQGGGRLRPLVAAQGLVQRLQPLVQAAIVLMQGQELTRQSRRRRHRLLQLDGGRRLGVTGHVGDGLAQVGDQAGVAVQIEQAGVHVEGPRQGDQNPRRRRALIGLDLRQVAGRQGQPPGAGFQRPAARLAQLAHLGPEVEFFRHRNFAKQPIDLGRLTHLRPFCKVAIAFLQRSGSVNPRDYREQPTP